MPNLLQELSTVTISTDSSPSNSADESATNLITNLGNRIANDNYPIIDVDIGYASYKSCYRVTEAEIIPFGHLFKLGFDLGSTYF